jgi:hypothetical protein
MYLVSGCPRRPDTVRHVVNSRAKKIMIVVVLVTTITHLKIQVRDSRASQANEVADRFSTIVGGINSNLSSPKRIYRLIPVLPIELGHRLF